MERVIKIGKTIRNNWKKSTVGVIALYYGANKAKEKYEINVLMRAACKEAVTYGDSLIEMDRNPTLITVILNPVANRRKAKQEFEKYCEPILHLAGLQVDVIQTTAEGNAKEIAESLKGTEAIIVAGGDGTLSETVTGLLRRNDQANQFPVGILPLGQTNTMGNTLFPGGKGVEKVKQLIDASMAIVKGNTVWKDAMKIEPIEPEEEKPTKPIYALTSIEWGVFRDTLARKDKYWIYGPWREYAAFIFNGYKNSLTWTCSGTVKYSPPCQGCSNCLKKQTAVKRWFFMPTMQASNTSDPASIENPDCATSHELCFKTSDFKIQTPNVDKSISVPALNIVLGKKNNYTYFDFVSDGWAFLKGKNLKADVISVRTVELIPKEEKDETMIEIDKEEFDVKPIKITLVPKVVKLFCKPDYSHG